MNRYHRWYCRSDRWRSRLGETVVPWVLRDYPFGPRVLEIGPGPGLTTDIIRARVEHVTAVEIDPALAASLRERLEGSNVEVIEADATALPGGVSGFDSAVAFTMLHHVPSADLQDRLLAGVFGALRPGGAFYGFDSTSSLRFRLVHAFDTLVPVDPATFGARLEAAGFGDVSVRPGKGAFRWRAVKPATT